MNEVKPPPENFDAMPGAHARAVYLVITVLALVLGFAGAILPLLPATPFFLLAVWAAARGSRRVHDWIYAQPWIARLLRDWHEQGAVPTSAKWLATAMMLTSLLTLIATRQHWGIVLALSLFFLAVGTFLWTRPQPRSD